jgi:SAM-dependent methyltransferase
MNSTTAGTSAAQDKLWSVGADDWATIQEGQVEPAYSAALDALDVKAGTALLDVGCGAGGALSLAADRGAVVTGLDATAALLAHARSRVPDADLTQGELESLPYADGSFDAVTSFNAFQFAGRPEVAVGEARRVVRPGGRVLALVWGPAETCEAAGYLMRLGALMPPPPAGTPGPFALSGEEALTSLFDAAGLDVEGITDVACVWSYPDEETALAGLLSSGPVVGIIAHAGEEAVRETTRSFLAGYRTDEGGYRLGNVFRFAIGAPRA